jgi:hypothetical protein
MLVLVGCEESQVVCKALREVGHEAYSCDLQPTRGNPEWHYKQDIMEVIPSKRWELIILHPDCTAMAVSGNRWYGKGMPMNDKRIAQVAWTKKLWDLARDHGERVALENPVSVIFKELSNVHYIQPWQFGHSETKKTGFALHNLDPLRSTNIVDGREQRVWKMPPSATRKRDRSKTFQGVADAIAQQWTTQNLIKED